jgi:nucleotide-binding universal stress UspA family protein
MTGNFTRILVPTDFSAASNAALALAKRMATTSGASLHLMHVLEDPSAAAAYATDVYTPPPAGITESWLKEAQRLLDTQLTPDERSFFRSTQVVVFGTPSRDIVNHAAANGIDLIVMGTHGRGSVHHLLMGSVAERVVRAAPCPVLTVRDTGKVRCEARGATATAVA